MLTTRKKLMVTSLGAALLASLSSAAIASAAEFGDDDSDSIEKTIACKSIGCQNGNRECGTASGGVKVGIPPFVGEVKVEYICYEPTPGGSTTGKEY